MNSSSANARSVASVSTHRFPWKWWLKDLDAVQKNGRTVFSCFSCGGGSSMGYKLAGYTVVGNCEIDPRMAKVYAANLHPKYPYTMDVRDFLKISNADLPAELLELDVLDGSPPCSVFSTAGEREDAWSKEKVFKEGQAAQRLDDLFFYFIQIAEKLRPKVVIAENVAGLLKGNAKGYVNEIFKAFDAAGYKTQLFLLDAARMGVPQSRQRCFFIARRKDLNLPAVSLDFHEKPITFGEVRTPTGIEILDGKVKRYLKYMKPTDKCVSDILEREIGEAALYGTQISQDRYVATTLTSSSMSVRGCDGMRYSDGDTIAVQTFPQDYDFQDQPVRYICGMSVPPVMMAQVATQVAQQIFKGEAGANKKPQERGL